jgi:hypothetical protein
MPSSLIRNGEGADMNQSVNSLSSDTNIGDKIAMALACQVKVLSSQQIAASWGSDACEESLDGTLSQLVESGLVTKSEWNVVPPPIDQCPAFTWRPTDAAPDGWRLSKQFRLRWKQPTQPIEVFHATAKAGRIFGSRCGSMIRTIEQQHDLLLSQVFVLYHERLPQLVQFWVGEQAMPVAERGVKNPDAFLIDNRGEPRRLIESAGAYSQMQVESFHRHCQQAGLPYELW